MSEYRLTNRGKFVLGLFILALVVVIVYSGSYIFNYLNKDDSLVVIEETTSSDETNEFTNTSNQETNETTGANETTEATEIETAEATDLIESTDSTDPTTEDKNNSIYTVNDLEDLKLFKIIFYFNEDDSEILLDQEDLDSIKSMIGQYKDEKIAIVGYTNGYPKFESNDEDFSLSLERAKFIRNSILQMGIDKNLINVYNYGSESPLYLDFGNQEKNNRVEVYFEDHYILGSKSK